MFGLVAVLILCPTPPASLSPHLSLPVSLSRSLSSLFLFVCILLARIKLFQKTGSHVTIHPLENSIPVTIWFQVG